MYFISVGNAGGEWSVNAKFRILLSEKVKVKTDFSEKIPLTPLVLEGEINAVFLKDYVFSVFPDPVPMFGTLFQMHLLNPDLGGITNPQGNLVLKTKQNLKIKNPQTKTSFRTNYIRKP